MRSRIRAAVTLCALVAAPAFVPCGRAQDAQATEPPRSDAAQQRAQEERQRSGDRRSRRVRSSKCSWRARTAGSSSRFCRTPSG